MRNMCLGITAVVVTVGMVSVGAQGRNFSGTWVIDGEKTMAASQAAGGEGGAVIARSAGGGGGGRAVGGGAVAVGGETRARAAVGGVGGGGGVMVSSDTVISMDANTFSTDIGGTHTSYPLNGSEVTIQVRNTEAKARASWKGDTLIIEQTIESPNGPVTSTTSWYMEGDSLVRLTTRKTYYKKK